MIAASIARAPSSAFLTRKTNPMMFMKSSLPTGNDSGFQCRCFHFPLYVAAGALILLLAGTARANIYATDVRLNGGFTNAHLVTATNVEVSYVLNEPAINDTSLAPNLHYPKHIVEYEKEGLKNMLIGAENNGLLYYGQTRYGFRMGFIEEYGLLFEKARKLIQLQ